VTSGPPAVTALVLAGGAASRMGGSKAERRLGGRSLLEHSLSLADAVADEVLLLPGQRTPTAEAAGRRCVADWAAGAGEGPLAALGAGLEAARHPWCLLLPCDMPWLRADVARRLVELAAGATEEVVAVRGPAGWEPFCALYRKTLVARARDELAAGRRSLVGLIERSAARAVAPGELSDLDPQLLSLRNLNTLTELEAAVRAECAS
jgi:molybdopterin-guanine dinucleotide biosynthesis protein A